MLCTPQTFDFMELRALLSAKARRPNQFPAPSSNKERSSGVEVKA